MLSNSMSARGQKRGFVNVRPRIYLVLACIPASNTSIRLMRTSTGRMRVLQGCVLGLLI